MRESFNKIKKWFNNMSIEDVLFTLLFWNFGWIHLIYFINQSKDTTDFLLTSMANMILMMFSLIYRKVAK